tara:strand:- start:89 stop:877 length:789 start_codon:yes stop_codon:yes gene_type:complete
MNEKIITFLNSGLLEKYLLGEISSEETEHVESYIARHPEVENAYNTLQFNLELVAKSNAAEAPKSILNNILEVLDEKPVVELNATKKYKKWHKIGIAASIAASIFAGQSYYLHSKNEKLSDENQVVVDEIFDLRSDIEMNNKRLDDIMHQFKQLNDPETYKYIMQGNSRAKNLKTIAYINAKEKTSMIDVVSLPQLPKEQCYQIWAELQGEMVSLGILSETDRQLRALPYTEDALGLNITIEPKGGNTIASLENSVAKIQLK